MDSELGKKLAKIVLRRLYKPLQTEPLSQEEVYAVAQAATRFGGVFPIDVWEGIHKEKPLLSMLGENIRNIRKRLGWSQAELGRYLGHKPGKGQDTCFVQISRWENGRHHPKGHNLEKLIDLQLSLMEEVHQDHLSEQDA